MKSLFVTRTEALDARLDTVIDQLHQIDLLTARLDAQRSRYLAESAEIADSRATLACPTGLGISDVRAGERKLVAVEIALATRRSERTVAGMINDAEELVRDYPTTLTALEEGRVSALHTRHLVAHASTLPAEARPAFETLLLAEAEVLPPARFAEKARRMRETAHPESITIRTLRAREERSVFLSPECDGMATLTHYLPAADAIAIDDLIDKIARAERPTPTAGRGGDTAISTHDGHAGGGRGSDPGGRGDGGAGNGDGTGHDGGGAGHDGGGGDGEVDMRTHLQRRSDALTRLILTPGNPAHPASITATVLVTVPAATIAGVSDEPGDLHGYGPIDPDTARAIAATAPTFLRVLTRPVTGEPTIITRHRGHPTAGTRARTHARPAEATVEPTTTTSGPDRSATSLTRTATGGDGHDEGGRERYSASPEMRLVLAAIDQTCRFPGCGRRANRCELDHTRDWALGGQTTPENLAYLCSRHHHLKHDTRWSVEPDPERPRHLNWRSPHGREYTTAPPRPPTNE